MFCVCWAGGEEIVPKTKWPSDPKNGEIFVYKPWRLNMFFFQIENVINVLVSCFRSIWIPMLCIYGH